MTERNLTRTRPQANANSQKRILYFSDTDQVFGNCYRLLAEQCQPRTCFAAGIDSPHEISKQANSSQEVIANFDLSKQSRRLQTALAALGNHRMIVVRLSLRAVRQHPVLLSRVRVFIYQ